MFVFVGLLVFGAVLLVVNLPKLRDQGLSGRHWMLLRALFPSWRFFEELGHVPKLSCQKVGRNGRELSEWKDCTVSLARSPWMIFLNARGNARMAENSLIEQLVTDLSELEDARDPVVAAQLSMTVEQMISYRLVQRLARQKARFFGVVGPEEFFRFRVIAVVPGDEVSGEEILISSVHEA